ncbi:hypothetical protein G6F46_014805 [Rhizopus delemar]|nr:hypothetical protein G6F46_014805 [Rhizopus delemar]
MKGRYIGRARPAHRLGAANGAGGLHQCRGHAHVAAFAQHLHEERQIGQQEAQGAAIDEEGGQDPPGGGARRNQQHHQRAGRQQQAAEHHPSLRLGLLGEEAPVDDAADRDRRDQRSQQQAGLAGRVAQHLLQ